ncbi:cellulose biosynthesis protein BcsE [Halomonas sp. HP20-15]|uniref:cellulose biosynthesis protein BcsE n=1 Tax=Halomonas sp. HP20-15 TaxID=3085901 RepID=UPI002981CCB6|nr:cellulose biosynthesis protein BcsE [Halomonas sp. HP20-15]MDW5377124.1 cellulose biosynthesis protein BcsE [Halomonas sp. HP20-15]
MIEPTTAQRQHFSLAVEGLWAELSALRCPGQYIVLADREPHLRRLAAGLLVGLEADALADWIVMGGEDERQPPGLEDPQRGPGRMTLWSLGDKAPRAALEALPDELDRARRWRRRQDPRLVLIKLPATALETLPETALAAWLRRWQHWCRKREACLVLLVHGSRSLSLRGRLQPHNDVLDGLAHLQPVGETGRYLVMHWRSDLRACGSHDMSLSKLGDGWQLLHAVEQEAAGGGDEHRYYVQRAALEEATLPGEHWRVFDDPNEVVVQAADAQAATIILALEHADRIEAVAGMMHGLRLQCGDAIKLVVREMMPCLRYRDERLMALSGVNLVVGNSVSFARFLSRVEGIQGQRFMRGIDPDFAAVTASLRPLPSSGVVSPAAFIEQIADWLAGDSAEAVSSLLVVLRPAGGLSASQALAQCRLTRQGDMATLIESRLYLFLFGCRLTDLDIALTRLFGVADSALFSSRQVFDRRETIALERHQLVVYGWDSQSQAPVAGADDIHAAAYAVPPGAAPIAPRPVSLALTTHAEEAP